MRCIACSSKSTAWGGRTTHPGKPGSYRVAAAPRPWRPRLAGWSGQPVFFHLDPQILPVEPPPACGRRAVVSRGLEHFPPEPLLPPPPPPPPPLADPPPPPP